MNLNKLIIDTLSFLNIPIKHLVYQGTTENGKLVKKETYITFFEVNNSDDDYSDEENEIEIHSVQIDYYTKASNDITTIKKNIKKALKTAGFKDVTHIEFYEDDTQIKHVAFRCYFYETINESEEI